MFPCLHSGPVFLKCWVSFPGLPCPVACEVIEADNATQTVIVCRLGQTHCDMVRFYQVSQVSLFDAGRNEIVQYFGTPRHIPALVGA